MSIKEPLKNYHKIIILISGILLEMVLGTVYAYSVLRIHLETTYQLTTLQSSLPYLLSLSMFALFMMLSGRFIKGKHVTLWIIFGIFSLSFGYIASSFLNSYIGFTIGYGIFVGMGVGILYGIPVKIIPALFKTKNGLITGLIIGGFGMSPIVTAPLLQKTLELTSFNQTLWVFGTAMGLLLIFFMLILNYKTHVHTLYPNTYDHAKGKRDSRFWFFFIIFTLGIMFGLSMIGLTSYIGIHHFNLDLSFISLLIMLFSLSNGLSRPLFGMIYDKYHIKPTVMIISLMTLLVCAYFIFFESYHVSMFIICMMLSWATVGAWLSLMPALTKSLFGELYFSRNYGLMYLSYGIAAIIGNIYTSILIDQHVDLMYVFIPIGVIILIMTIAVSVMKINQEPLHHNIK